MIRYHSNLTIYSDDYREFSDLVDEYNRKSEYKLVYASLQHATYIHRQSDNIVDIHYTKGDYK